MRYITFFLLVQSCLFQLNAQQQFKLSFTHDNDLYFLTDRYYSAGNNLSFTTYLSKKKQSQKRLLKFTIGQNILTPAKKSIPDTTRFDRPFAGWLFVDTELSMASSTDLFFMEISLGLTGPQSLADKTQRNYHRLIGEQLPTWYLQIPNEFHANLNFKYQKNLTNKHLLTHSSVAFGTKDIFIENGLEWFWGSHYNFFENAFTGISNHLAKEWFLTIGAFYKYTFYNALIEGSLFNNKAPFTKEIENHVGLIRLRGFYKVNNKSLEMSYHFNSKENKEASSHSFLSIKLSIYFEDKKLKTK